MYFVRTDLLRELYLSCIRSAPIDINSSGFVPGFLASLVRSADSKVSEPIPIYVADAGDRVSKQRPHASRRIEDILVREAARLVIQVDIDRACVDLILAGTVKGSANDQVLPTVAVHVARNHREAEIGAAYAARQHRLQLPRYRAPELRVVRVGEQSDHAIQAIARRARRYQTLLLLTPVPVINENE